MPDETTTQMNKRLERSKNRSETEESWNTEDIALDRNNKAVRTT